MKSDGVILSVEDSSGPEGYSAVFEATDGSEEDTPAGGFLYVYDVKGGAIVRHLEIYKSPAHEIKDSDIRLFWSRDNTKCGVAIWGRMRGIIDIIRNQQVAVPMENPASPAVTDPEWLRGFDKYMDQEQFIRTRQRFWKQKVREYEPEVQPRPDEETPIETNFIVFDGGIDDLFAVFEDDGDTGYLYVLDTAKQDILQYLQIYDRAKALNVSPEDVRVAWSEDGSKCGVLIWNKMRGIADRVRNREGRVKLEDRESPGIDDEEWLKGFEHP
jgi:hypothetical protein